MFSFAAHHQPSRNLGTCSKSDEVKETHGGRQKQTAYVKPGPRIEFSRCCELVLTLAKVSMIGFSNMGGEFRMRINSSNQEIKVKQGLNGVNHLQTLNRAEWVQNWPV